MQMKKQFDYGFYLTKRERRGITVLSLIVLMLISYQTIRQNQFATAKKPLDWIEIEKMVESQNTDIYSKNEPNTEHQFIDPNKASEEEFVALGLSQKIAKNIINYREKVRKFENPEDLKKIYTLSEKDYLRLLPLINISDKNSSVTNADIRIKEKLDLFADGSIDPNLADSSTLSKLGLDRFAIKNLLRYREKGGKIYSSGDLEKIYGMDQFQLSKIETKWAFPEKELRSSELQKIVHAPEVILLDINAATIPEWQYLNGIGPGFAQRIVSFREKLGGFISVEQVAETYQLPDTLFEKIKPQLVLISPATSIPINTCSKEDLSRHPYISYKQADLLINYRNHHGPYREINDLNKILVLDSNWIRKVSPYLDFEPL